MSTVSVAGLSKRYGQTVALDDVSIDFSDGELVGLLGPSGSGKTTLLRCIAGFVAPDAGAISIDGRPLTALPVHRRDVGMVFQHYALFPHLSVVDNVAFGLAVRGVARGERRRRVAEALAMVRLEGLERRRPRQLSGGQQQRVALARALITRPRLLLLDEPLGALDKNLRQDMQVELKQLQRSLRLTTVFVTHDQQEALGLSDRVAIIDRGRLEQIGTPEDIYEHPRSEFAAAFLGAANFFRGRAGVGDGVEVLQTKHGPLYCTEPLPTNGAPATLAVRPEKIHLQLLENAAVAIALLADDRPNRLTGRLLRRVYSGSSVSYQVELDGDGGGELTVFEQNRDRDRVVLAPGDRVAAVWAARHSVLVSR